PCCNKDTHNDLRSNQDQVNSPFARIKPSVLVVTRNPSNSRGSQDQALSPCGSKDTPSNSCSSQDHVTIFVVTRIQYTSLCGSKDLASSPCGNKEPGTNPCGNKDSTHQALR
ncbi:hypothetical protein ACLKA7_005462, partial [Drosophila subpalustris]